MANGSEQTGTIRKHNGEKGYGFIQAGQQSLFFHRSSVKGGNFRFDDLREGDVVTFVEGDDEGKGPRASIVWKD